MSEKLTVAELMARNAKDGARRADRPRRRRNLEDGGVSVSELTGSIPVVSDEDLDGTAEASDVPGSITEPAADEHPHRGGHEREDAPEAPEAPEAPTDAPDAEAPTDAPDADVIEGEVVSVEADDGIDVADDPEEGDAGETAVFPAAAPAGRAAAAETPDAAPDAMDATEAPDAQTEQFQAEAPEAPEAPETPEVAEVPDAQDEPEGAGAEAEAEDPNKIIEYEDDAISWPALLGQTAVAVIIGVVIFFGFTLLWDKLATILVLVMSAVVTLGCVGVVHALLRHRHTLVLILAFIVGLVITLGPRLIMSI